MAFSRSVEPRDFPRGHDLTSSMVGIGMLFSAEAAKNPNIEDTLVAASIEGMTRDDLRVLSVLVTWLRVHHAWVNADRLTRVVAWLPLADGGSRARAFWSAIATWLEKDRRFGRLRDVYEGPRIDLLRTGSEFQIRRRGEDPRFKEGPLRAPEGVLRDRVQDVLTPNALAHTHSTYRHRILMGPSYRADMWALLEMMRSLSAAELARRSYGSFATAWQVKHDFALLWSSMR